MILRARCAKRGIVTRGAATPAQPDFTNGSERETGREPFDLRTASNGPQGLSHDG